MEFRSIFSGVEPTWQDCSNKFQERFKEIPPYACDLATGKILNKTSKPMIVKDEPFDIDEYIQSFKADCDIYAILEKFAFTGCTDTSLINKGVMSFGDISDLPDNINDMNEYFNKANGILSNYSDDVGKMILDDKYSADDIKNFIQNKINDLNKVNEETGEVK